MYRLLSSRSACAECCVVSIMHCSSPHSQRLASSGEQRRANSDGRARGPPSGVSTQTKSHTTRDFVEGPPSPACKTLQPRCTLREPLSPFLCIVRPARLLRIPTPRFLKCAQHFGAENELNGLAPLPTARLDPCQRPY